MQDVKGTRIWVGVLGHLDELEGLLELFDKEADNHDNRAVIVGPGLSFAECARLDDTFDFVVRLGEEAPEKFNMLFWDHVTLLTSSMKTNLISNHQTNGNAGRYIGVPESNENEAIAIVGMSCRLPGANDAANFWSNLIKGRDSISPPLKDRWRADQGCNHLTLEHAKTRAGFLSCPVDTFDGAFWGLSPLELGYTDPQARMLLQLSWEALEHAGIPPKSLHASNASVFLGLWRDEYKHLLLQNGSCTGGDELRRYLGCSLGNTAARISHALGITGPATATDTGCSSSMISFGLAMDALRQGKTKLALAGGANLLLKPFVYSDFQGVLSPFGKCKVFQEDADGYVRAEGAVLFVLKKARDAISNGDRIYALLRGFGSSQDGLSRSVGTPTIGGEARAIFEALKDARVSPDDVDWVEMHASGTKVGDTIEIAATRKAYAVEDRNHPLVLTSVKANIGHSEGVSGAAGLLKVILSMEHGAIPPQRLTGPLNPNLQFDGMHIPNEVFPWKGNMAGISSFGITGTNAHLIVERASNNDKRNREGLTTYVLPLSAKCFAAMKELKNRHVLALNNLNDLDLGNYCYTAATCRNHFQPFRSAVVASSREKMIESLLNGNTIEPTLSYVENDPPKLCFLFPGQGSQYFGMGKELYKSCVIFRRHFDIVDSLLTRKYGVNLQTLLFEGTAVALYSQLCIFAVEYSLLKVWGAWGLVPSIVLGHSFGEIAASIAAGALCLPTALEIIVGIRTNLFAKLEPGGMLVLNADEITTNQLITDFRKLKANEADQWIDIACLNSSEQTVISAPPDTITSFSTFCEAKGVRNTRIGVPQAYHSRALEPIGAQFEKEAGKLSYSRRFPLVGYISAVDGKMLDEIDVQDASYWRRNMRQKVEFMKAARAALDEGKGRIFLEVGPNPILSALMNNMAAPGVKILCVPSMRKGTSELSTILETAATLYVNGFELDWSRVWNSLGTFDRIPEILPLYPFQSDQIYWFTPEVGFGMHSLAVQNQGIPGKLVHPLLGMKLATPERSTHIFVTSTAAILQRAGVWLQDHKLGPHVIFPGAGYAEMAFAAVIAVVKIKIGVELEEFVIKTSLPLEIEAELQTLVEENEHDFKVAFYSRKGDEAAWKLHATTKVTLLRPDEKASGVDDQVEESEITVQERNTDSIYEKIREYGYNFGSAFKTLQNSKPNSAGSSRYDISCPQDFSGYLLHPIIIDAMFQAALLVEPLNGLKLPTGIASLKIHTIVDRNGARLRVLATKAGSRLMILEGNGHWIEIASLLNLTTVSTTLAEFEKAAGLFAEIKLVPHFVEEWTETGNFVDEEDPTETEGPGIAGNVAPFTLKLDTLAELRRIEAFVCNCIVSTLHTLGWKWKEGCVVSEKKIASKLGITTITPQFLRRLLYYTEGGGFIKRLSSGEWKVLLDFGNLGQFETRPGGKGNVHESVLDAEWKFAKFYAEKLGVILRGTESVLVHLFPPDDGNLTLSAEALYTSFIQCTGLLDNLSAVFSIIARTYKGRAVRILEVGGGTGSATRRLLHLLEGSFAIYTFTDISHYFLTKAEETLPKHYGVQLEFCVLDVEKDPLSQCFNAGSYDAIIAFNVLHATVDVEAVCSNLRKLLRPHGHLVVAEQMTPSPLVDIIFGHCEGYWRFDDIHREDHCLLGKAGWEQVLNRAGYVSTICVESGDIGMGIMVANNHSLPFSNWIMVADASSFSTKLVQFLGPDQGTRFDISVQVDKQTLGDAEQFVFLVPDSEDKNENYEREKLFLILESFLRIAQSLKNAKKLHLVSHGVAGIKDEYACFPLAAPLIGVSRTLANEFPGVEVRWVDLDPTEDEDARVGQLAKELKLDEKTERFVSYRGGQRHIAKLVPLQKQKPLRVPEGKVQLRLPSSRSIADVEWESISEETKSLKSNEIEVRILASGLNFRDLLTIMKPTPEFLHAVCAGDFAGDVIGVGSSVTRWAVGDSVIGVNQIYDPFPNHTIMDADFVAALGPTLTHTEGASFPTAFMTAYHCLVDVGSITFGQTVLIHTASGGVGLAAIQVARAVGAKIICTAGSRRKRAFLRSLGLSHIYNSRDLSFAQGVMADTDGFGVDLVLNSLTSKGWKEASLSVTSLTGRFVEMSKLNIWTPMEVAKIRPDVLYTVVDLSIPDRLRLRHLMGQLELWLADGRLKPLRLNVFEPEYVNEALGQLEKALHIGKVVIRRSSNLFNERSTYLITGGTGALGLEIMKWMLTSGANHVVLVSRRSGGAEAALAKFKEEQIDISGVVVMAVDVGNQSQVAHLIEHIAKHLPPLRGIMHAAGVVSDSILGNQNMAKMEEVFKGKVDGAWFLHSATQHLPLEHFVLFSSAVWVLGGPAQANHAAASASLAALAEHRHRLGLPATCIAWGYWGETGIAAKNNRRIFGVEPFTTECGLHSLNHLLRRNGVCNVMAAELSDDVTRGWLRDYVEQSEEVCTNQEMKVEQEDGANIEDRVRNIIAKILRIRGGLEGQQQLRVLGMDSLMFIELKNKLLSSTGLSFEIQDSATVDEVVFMVTNAMTSS